MKPFSFKRYLLIALACSLIGLTIVFSLSGLALRGERPETVTGVMDAVETGLGTPLAPSSASSTLNFWVVGFDGRVLRASTPTPFKYSWSEIPKPVGYNLAFYPPSRLLRPSELAIRRMRDGSGYLIIRSSAIFHGMRGTILMAILAQIAVTLAAVGLSLLGAVSYLREGAREADSILSRLRNGDLQARFKTGRFDELAGTLTSFNHMADEIAALVGRLREAERARTSLLRELGHDVRTPLTSLRGFIENVLEHGDRLGKDEREENLRLALSELGYLHRLLEDLLFLAQLSDPTARTELVPLDLAELVAGELELLGSLCESKGLKLESSIHAAVGGATVRGNPILLRRLLRNAVDNSLRYAKTEIRVGLRADSAGLLILSIDDDGAGFPPEKLASFGGKASVRTASLAPNAIASLGLGSTIMRAIAELHGGRLSAGNRDAAAGGGAQITIFVPRAALQ